MRPQDPTTADPLSSDFWDSASPQLLRPPGTSSTDRPHPRDLGTLCPPGSLVFPTSGSTGSPKAVVITRDAILASAELVVRWLGIRPDDQCLLALPSYHVGGIGVIARARMAQCALHHLPGKWCPIRVSSTCRDLRISITSLVPTQIHDIVQAGMRAPPTLRTVVVGGGALSPALAQTATSLGWPVLASFGMTETSSQIATEKMTLSAPGESSPPMLPLISGWHARSTPDYRLAVRGPALAKGILTREQTRPGQWTFQALPLSDGWWTTTDLAHVRTDDNGQTWIQPLGRADDQIKIRGELVSLAAMQWLAEKAAADVNINPALVAVTDTPDPRAGSLLALILEPKASPRTSDLRRRFNELAPPFARIAATHTATIPSLPRSPLGKIRRAALRSFPFT